ncbi:hypothetical protein NIES2107_08400 [Nostoc carneum NIES-2107]|nr:hypothetical protein NIES2107_08400 [Nostoc carneum NIES-2107]
MGSKFRAFAEFWRIGVTNSVQGFETHPCRHSQNAIRGKGLKPDFVPLRCTSFSYSQCPMPNALPLNSCYNFPYLADVIATKYF